MNLQPFVSAAIAVALAAVALAVVVVAAVRAWRTRGAGAGRPAAVRFPTARWAATWVRRGVIVLVALAIVLGPATLVPSGAKGVSNTEVYFVVDRTASMGALDFGDGGTRLAGVAHDIETLLGKLPGCRYSILSYTGSAQLSLPLTDDQSAVETWARTLYPEMSTKSDGSSLARPHDLLLAALQAAKKTRPQDRRYVFFMSDGEATADTSGLGLYWGTSSANQDYADVRAYANGGAVLGYGTTAGARMLAYDGSGAWAGLGLTGASPSPTPTPTGTTTGSQQYVIDDTTGQPAVSKLDPDALSTLASQLGVPYIHRTGPDDMKWMPKADIDYALVTQETKGQELRPLIWPLGWLLAALAAWEGWELLARSRRRRPLPPAEAPTGGAR
ncbi:MAG: VWA domain-containing protein [Bifidobacteriaceae bacterium]|jgi:Ca-activated chloride channel family protein|nr:VWA domain-containing protein [Bifidobacteriaceae bacterium]